MALKRKDIMDGLNADARLAYFQMFNRSAPIPSPETASVQFEQLYTKWYGRRFYITPALLLFSVGAIAVSSVVLTVLDTIGYVKNPLLPVPPTAVAAIAGAYFWVSNDLISRARRLDFSPSDILWGVLRIAISIPMGYAFATVVAESIGPFVAFAIGAFPLTTLTTMLQRLTNKNLGLEDSQINASDGLIKLQGINRAIVERLANEDITTITQIAYCDPVRLTMRSNLSFNFIIDCMNQALAWMYLQEDLDKIRPLGMRGAGEIDSLIDSFDDIAATDPSDQADHARALAAFPLIAAKISQDPATLHLVFRQIATDPYTVFLQRIWT